MDAAWHVMFTIPEKLGCIEECRDGVQETKDVTLPVSVVSLFFSWEIISSLLQQYQSAIRAHKAGKEVNFEELPVPPGEIFFLWFIIFIGLML